MPLYARELAWFEEGNEKVLGLIAVDMTDDDYVYYVLGRDAKGRFRNVDFKISIATEDEATSLLEHKLIEHSALPADNFFQGDEKGKPLDFFTPLVASEKLNSVFKHFSAKKGYSPGRELMTQMMYYFQDLDGNFVKDFQTTGFDARLWELYLYATFTEVEYGLVRDHSVPDFHCRGLRGEFFVEATTVNPPANPVTFENEDDYFDHYVPMKFSGVLTDKLKKEYWKHEHVKGHPLLFAIQDFHAPGSMIWTSTPLVEYLYGFRQIEQETGDGGVEIVIQKVPDYQWGKKPPIPAGFFLQPDSENISAVLANPNGTITKFNRMGFLAGFGDPKIMMLRKGSCYRDGKAPEEFVDEVHAEGYKESWEEGLCVYHNPNALLPLSPDSFPNAAQFSAVDGKIIIEVPAYHPIASQTLIIDPV